MRSVLTGSFSSGSVAAAELMRPVPGGTSFPGTRIARIAASGGGLTRDFAVYSVAGRLIRKMPRVAACGGVSVRNSAVYSSFVAESKVRKNWRMTFSGWVRLYRKRTRK